MTGNIDVAAMTYSLSEAALKAGFRSMVDAAELKAPYQGPSVCALKEVLASRQDLNPKIAQVDIEQIIDSSYVRNLESNGFLAELRKKTK